MFIPDSRVTTFILVEKICRFIVIDFVKLSDT